MKCMISLDIVGSAGSYVEAWILAQLTSAIHGVTTNPTVGILLIIIAVLIWIFGKAIIKFIAIVLLIFGAYILLHSSGLIGF